MDRSDYKLDIIIRLLVNLNRKDERFMTILQDVQAEVAAEKTIDDGLLVLLNNLEANQNDPVALAALLADLKANIGGVAANLVANTPAAPITG